MHSILPNNLKVLRVKFGHTQKDISRLLSISSVQYSKKERGKAPFLLVEAKVLSEHYNLAIEDIFFVDNINTVKT